MSLNPFPMPGLDGNWMNKKGTAPEYHDPVRPVRGPHSKIDLSGAVRGLMMKSLPIIGRMPLMM
jgi:hypothetical protein